VKRVTHEAIAYAIPGTILLVAAIRRSRSEDDDLMTQGGYDGWWAGNIPWTVANIATLSYLTAMKFNSKSSY